MREVRPSIWFAALCVGLGVLFLARRHENVMRHAAVTQAQASRHESFRRVSPTAPAPASVATLVAELNDFSPNVRERAAVELGNAGMAALEVAPELKRLAGNDPDDGVRRAARMALYNVRGWSTFAAGSPVEA